MSRNRVIAVSVFIFCMSQAHAAREAAIDAVLRPLISDIAADPNAGGWTWNTNFNGGYLLRLDMDVTGEGRTEMFIASTLESTKHEHYWIIFDVNKDGIARPYSQRLRFSSAWPIEENGKTLLMYIGAPNKEMQRDNVEKAYPAFKYEFSFPKIDSRTFYVDQATAYSSASAGENHRSQMLAILLYDYVMLPQAPWVDAKTLLCDATDRYFRPEDKERAMRNTTFTPQVALAMLDGTKPAPISAPVPASPEAAATPPHSPVPAAEPQILKQGEEPTLVSSTRWSALLAAVVLTGAALVLVRRVIKRRQ